MLILTRRKNEKIVIGEAIEIWVVDIRGDTVKLGIKAPLEVKVYRQEVLQEIQNANKAAASLDRDVKLPDINRD